MKLLQLGLIVTLSFFLVSVNAQTVSSGAGSGDWSDPLSWTPNTVPTAVNTTSVNIQSGHTITVTDTRSIDQLTVNGTLVVNNGVVFTIANAAGIPDATIASTGVLTNNGTVTIANGTAFPANLCQLSVVGTFENNGTITFGGASSRLAFQAGSTYNHIFTTTAGVIPSGAQVTWNATSTCRISGYTTNATAPTGLGQNFGHFVWDTQNLDLNGGSGGALFDLNGALTNVQGNLTVESTGPFGDALFLTFSTPYSATAIDNFTVNGGFVALTGDADITFNVSQNFSIGAAAFFATNLDAANASIDINGNLSVDGSCDFAAGAGTTNLNLAGDIDAAGVIQLTGGSANIMLDGTTQALNNSLDFGTGLVTFVVGDGATTTTFNLGANSITSDGDFFVADNSELIIGASGFISGSGDFSLGSSVGSNSILQVASTNATGAIAALTGNIRTTGTRTYTQGSTIIYNGTAAQFMSAAHPSTTGVSCVINNSAGVTLATSVTIGGDLTLTSGNLSLSTRTLTLNGNFTPNSNFLNVLSTSSIVIGGTGAFGTLATTGSTTIFNFTINRPSSGSVTLGSNLTIAGTLTQTNGDIVLNGRTFTISGPYVRTFGNFNVDAAATIIVNGSGALPAAAGFQGGDLNTFTINRASSTFATSSAITLTNLNLLSGTFNNSGTITMNQGGILTRTEGSIINNTPTTNPTTNSYNVVYNIATDISTGAEIPSLVTQLGNVTKDGGGTLTLTENLTINGNLLISNGSFNASTFAIDLKGNFTANSTSTLTSSSFTFSGSSVVSGAAIIRFGAVIITGTVTPTVNVRIDGNLVNDGNIIAGSGSQTVTFGGTTTISGGSTHNFNNIIIAGTLTAPASMNVAGNFTFTSGAFNSSAGTVVFNGTSSIVGTPSFHTITVSGTLNGPTNLNLTGDLNINGTFNSGAGRVTFNGTSNQRLDRTSGSAGTIDLFDVTVNKASGTFGVNATIGSTIFRVQNEFTIAQAGSSTPDIDFDGISSTAGTFVLRSTSTRTAKITAVPSNTSFVGSLTAERFVQNTDGIRAYRYLASPVAGATVADWQGEIQITGAFSNPSTGPGIPNPNVASMFRYIETNGGLSSNRYSAYPDNISLPASSFPLTNGTGYAVFVRDTGTPTITVRGTLNSGNINIPVTITGTETDAAGFNLVGNPYPAPVDWDLVTLPGGVSPVISLLDNVANGGLGGGQFVYYSQGGAQVGNFDGKIGSGQAFWVETSANATLTFTESNKASDVNPVIVREGQIANLLRIHVGGNDRMDEAVVYFTEDASDNYDIGYDARKRENEFINLFSYKNNELTTDKYAINALNGIECSREILLGLEKFTEGTYSFEFSELESFIKPYVFTLVDNFTGTSVSLNGSYEFQVTSNPASSGLNRFKILISNEAISNSLSVAGSQECDNKNLKITIDDSQNDISYQPYYNGVTVGDAVHGNGSTIVIDLEGEAFATGLFEVSIKAFTSCSEVFLDQKATIEIFGFDAANIGNEGNTLVSNYTHGNQWYFNGTLIPGATSQYYDVTESGLYTLVVTTEQCTTSDDLNFRVTDAEQPFMNTVEVYPNPFKDKFRFTIESVEPVNTRLYGALGVLVTEKLLDGQGASKSVEFDLSGNPPGIYILHIQKGSRIHQLKVIKNK